MGRKSWSDGNLASLSLLQNLALIFPFARRNGKNSQLLYRRKWPESSRVSRTPRHCFLRSSLFSDGMAVFMHQSAFSTVFCGFLFLLSFRCIVRLLITFSRSASKVQNYLDPSTLLRHSIIRLLIIITIHSLPFHWFCYLFTVLCLTSLNLFFSYIKDFFATFQLLYKHDCSSRVL